MNWSGERVVGGIGVEGSVAIVEGKIVGTSEVEVGRDVGVLPQPITSMPMNIKSNQRNNILFICGRDFHESSSLIVQPIKN